MVHQMRHNPETSCRLLDLQGDYEGIGEDVVEDDDGLRIVDAFQVHGLIARNQFHLDDRLETSERSLPADVFIQASCMNNCCVPNAKRHIIGDLLLLNATKAIAEDEEITISYQDT